MTEPWNTPEGKKVWKTEAEYFQWIRGQLRRIWSDYPIRKQWKSGELRPVTAKERSEKKYHPSTKNVGQCVMCKEWMAGSKLECDHIHPSNGCKGWEDLSGFLHYCSATLPDEFQLICKPCHRVKTYAERMGITFEEASIQKRIITLMKDKKKIDKLLAEHGKACNNDSTRRKGLEELIKEKKL